MLKVKKSHSKLPSYLPPPDSDGDVNQRLETALHYAEEGFPVLPLHSIRNGKCTCGRSDCTSPGKHPISKHGVKDATTKTIVIRSWWQKYPYANIGIATGSISGIVVLDVDPRNGGNDSLSNLIKLHGPLPKTIEVRTGGGGLHLIYRYPHSNESIRCAVLAPGLDRKADGGYIVAAPSNHISGRNYAWKSRNGLQRSVLAMPPDWLLAEPHPSLIKHTNANGKFISGERNQQLTSLAGILRKRGLSEKSIFRALADTNRECCSPPLHPKELLSIARSVSRYKPGAISRTKLVVRQLSQIEAEEVQWLWQDRIALGKVTMLAGDPGLGKSYLTLHMAASVTNGSRWPDKTAIPEGSVLLLSAEDDAGDTIRPRAEKMGANLERIRIIEGVRCSTEGGEMQFSLARDLSALRRQLKKMKDCRLIIIDPITAYLGGETDSHKNSDVRALLAPLAKLAAKYRVAVVCVTHLSKGVGGKAMYRSTGSLAFVAAARAGWLVAKHPDDEDRRVFVCMKNNLAKSPSGLAFQIKDERVVWNPDPVSLSADQIMAMESTVPEGYSEGEGAEEFINETLSAGPVAASLILKEAKQNGISRNTLGRAKKRLGIKVQRVGGTAANGHWEWSLPN